jgi:ADP-heptose:LPS heptosyltransferase
VPERILLINFNKIGDTVLQTQLYSGIKSALPEATLTLLCSPTAYQIAFNNPHINNISLNSTIPDRSLWAFLKYWAICLHMIWKYKIDTVVCDAVNSTPVTAILLNLLPVKNKIFCGYLRTKLYRQLTLPLNNVLKNKKDLASNIEYNKKILSVFTSNPEMRAEIYATAEEKLRVKSFIGDIRNQANGPLIALAPFASERDRSWPKENIEDLLLSLPQNSQIVICGSMNELNSLDVSRQFKDRVHKTAGLNLREVFEVIKQCDLFVAVDSGPSHFFLALDIPMIQLFSKRKPYTQWGYHGMKNYSCVASFVDCGAEEEAGMGAIPGSLVAEKVRSVFL